jgi:ornithine carbamoyltransferase
MRTYGHDRVEKLARAASIPVVNALTDLLHPCQLLADLLAIQQEFGFGIDNLRGLRCAWIGDGNNMAHSWINAAAMLGLELVVACPEGYEPDSNLWERGRATMAEGGRLELVRDPREAARGAHVISTDVWASMGQEDEAERRRKAFAGYCVDEALVAEAAADSIILHCLPAHRGEEISAVVLEGPRSRVWRQAENRLHAQKALLEAIVPG